VELYYQHRVPDSISVEDVAAVMGELIAEGKILGWGQSQATEEQIRRAHAVTPLTAIQSEYSIMERMFEKDVIPVCEELGIGFVPFSPLASGFLSGKVTVNDTYTGDDVRRVITRFDKDNIRANQPLLDLLTAFAKEKGTTPAQISLAVSAHTLRHTFNNESQRTKLILLSLSKNARKKLTYIRAPAQSCKQIPQTLINPLKYNPALKKEQTCGPLLVKPWLFEPKVLAASKLAQVRKL
jgi:diketogulonate reductase-like aldo/keto reductase